MKYYTASTVHDQHFYIGNNLYHNTSKPKQNTITSSSAIAAPQSNSDLPLLSNAIDGVFDTLTHGPESASQPKKRKRNRSKKSTADDTSNNNNTSMDVSQSTNPNAQDVTVRNNTSTASLVPNTIDIPAPTCPTTQSSSLITTMTESSHPDDESSSKPKKRKRKRKSTSPSDESCLFNISQSVEKQYTKILSVNELQVC